MSPDLISENWTPSTLSHTALHCTALANKDKIDENIYEDVSKRNHKKNMIAKDKNMQYIQDRPNPTVWYRTEDLISSQ